MISGFLQSPEWENFQQSLGRKTWRVDGQLIVRHKLPFGFNYLYSPRPHIDPVRSRLPMATVDPALPDRTSNGVKNADSFFAKAHEIAKKEKAIFLKIDPSDKFQVSPTKSRVLDKVGTSFKFQASNPLQPRKTVILDLSKSDEELLAATHEKTRYNIRLAERKGVKIILPELVEGIPSLNPNFEMFWNLLRETARRDGFHTHEQSYYEKLLKVRSENFSNELFFAEYQGKTLAAALVNWHSPGSGRERTELSPDRSGLSSVRRVAAYLHGASSREHNEVMAPYLLHWRIIQEARKRGFNSYDFWGIDEKRWPGLTRFKKGFGGEIREYPPSRDIVYRPLLYRIYRAARKIF